MMNPPLERGRLFLSYPTIASVRRLYCGRAIRQASPSFQLGA